MEPVGQTYLLRADSDRKKGDSTLSGFIESVAVNGLVFILLFSVFLLLRKRFPRIYSPRTFAGSIPNEKQPDLLPNGVSGFLKGLAGLP